MELCDLVINPTKCDLGRPELSYLGLHISVQGTSTLPAGVQAVADFPSGWQEEFREFLTMVKLYHRLIPHCAGKLYALHHLLSLTKYI